MRFGADGVVALEVTGDEIVGVDEFADGDGLGSKANDLVELTDGLAGGDGANRQFVSSGNIRGRGEAQTVERLACGERLEGDHNVVRRSELKGLAAQTVLIISEDMVVRTRSVQSLVRPHSTPSTR